MLKATITGNLGADPEVRYTANGDELVSFRVAVNQKRKNKEGEDEEITTWFRVRCFGMWAERAKDLVKGARVYVYGRLDVGSYTGNDGERRTSLDIRCDELEPFSRAERTEGGEAAPRTERSERTSRPAQRPAAAAAAASNGGGGGRHVSDDELEDLPFNMPRHINEPWLRWRESL